MSKTEKQTAVGRVIEMHPNNIYMVECIDGSIVKGYLAGKLKRARLSVLIGDKVKFEIDEYGANYRITRRL